MATFLRNIVRFTGLIHGVPTVLPHRLNIDGTPVVPNEITTTTEGFTVTVDDTNVSVTPNSEALDHVDVMCHHWHTIGAEAPNGIAVPFLPQYGLVPIFTIWARSTKGFIITGDANPTFICHFVVNRDGTDPATCSGAGMLIFSAAASDMTGTEVATWISTIPIQYTNGTIFVIPATGLPLDMAPAANTVGAANWRLRLSNPQPSMAHIEVIGDPNFDVQWTVRLGGTFTPHVAD